MTIPHLLLGNERLLNPRGGVMRSKRVGQIKAMEPFVEPIMVRGTKGPGSIQLTGIRCAYCDRIYISRLPALRRHLQDEHEIILPATRCYEDLHHVLAKKIAYYREQNELSPEDLGRAIGKNSKYIEQIEAGQRKLNSPILAQLAMALQIRFGELVPSSCTISNTPQP